MEEDDDLFGSPFFGGRDGSDDGEDSEGLLSLGDGDGEEESDDDGVLEMGKRKLEQDLETCDNKPESQLDELDANKDIELERQMLEQKVRQRREEYLQRSTEMLYDSAQPVNKDIFTFVEPAVKKDVTVNKDSAQPVNKDIADVIMDNLHVDVNATMLTLGNEELAGLLDSFRI